LRLSSLVFFLFLLATKSCFFLVGVATHPRIVAFLLGGLISTTSNYFYPRLPTFFLGGLVSTTSSSLFCLVLLTSMEFAFNVWVGNKVLLTLMGWAGNIIHGILILELGKESFVCPLKLEAPFALHF